MPIVQIGISSVVNQITAGDQTDPQVTRSDDGSVYTYTSVEGGVSVIRLAHFNHEGERIGNDIVVSQAGSADNMSTAFVGHLSNGTIIVTWVDTTTGAGYFRAYDGTSLAALTGPTQVTQTSSVDPTFQGLGFAEAANGNIIFSWTTNAATGDGNGTAIHSRLLSSNLSTFVANESQSNTSTVGDQARVRDTILGNGNFLVTYQSTDAPADLNMRGQVIDAITGLPIGNDFIINSTVAGDQQRGRARLMDDGRTVVVYESSDIGDGNGSCIRMRFLDANGVPQGTDQIVNTTTLGNQRSAFATVMDDGRVVLSWSSFEVSGSGGTQVAIRARIMNADGTFPEGDFSLGIFPTNSTIPFSGVRTTPDGRIVLTVGTPTLSADGSGLSTETRTFVVTSSPGNTSQVLTGDQTSQSLSGTASVESWIDGQAGNDTITMTGIGTAHFYGNAGNDSMTGGALNDVLFGGTGNDTLNGAGGNDVLVGEEGSDTIDGGAGDDSVIGGAGADVLAGGNNTVVGDTVSYFGSSVGVFVNLQTQFATSGDATGDVISGFENAAGGSGADVLIGSSGNNTLSGAAGNDYIYAGAGQDVVNGGAGNDVLFGDADNDTVNGGGGTDYVFGGTGTNILSGGGGIDIIISDGLNDMMFGGSNAAGAGGAGTVNYFYVNPGSFNPTVYGDQGQDIFIDVSGASNVAATVHGGGGGDYVFAGGGNDSIFGEAGNDVLSGGGGNDTMSGGAGVDYATGGAGNDRFDVGVNDGILLITDFVGGGTDDTVRLFGTSFTNFSQVQSSLTAVGSGMILVVDADTQVWFLGLNPTSLTASDFTFV